MSILIQLSRDDVARIIRHVPLASDLSRKLWSSERINCSQHQAQELLRIARQHCSDAVLKSKAL